MTCSRFLAMITTSTIVMLGLTYVNNDAFSHALFSETRAYMAIGMGAVMAVIMLLFMRKMYRIRRLNLALVAARFLIFAVSLFLVRSQATVQDVSWMRAIIPHLPLPCRRESEPTYPIRACANWRTRSSRRRGWKSPR